MWKKVLGVDATVEPMERKAWLDAFYAGTWDVFSDDLVGDFAGPETFLAAGVNEAEAEAGMAAMSEKFREVGNQLYVGAGDREHD